MERFSKNTNLSVDHLILNIYDHIGVGQMSGYANILYQGRYIYVEGCMNIMWPQTCQYKYVCAVQGQLKYPILVVCIQERCRDKHTIYVGED